MNLQKGSQHGGELLHPFWDQRPKPLLPGLMYNPIRTISASKTDVARITRASKAVVQDAV